MACVQHSCQQYTLLLPCKFEAMHGCNRGKTMLRNCAWEYSHLYIVHLLSSIEDLAATAAPVACIAQLRLKLAVTESKQDGAESKI